MKEIHDGKSIYFDQMQKSASYLLELWDIEKSELDLKKIEKSELDLKKLEAFLNSASTGKCTMCRFFVAIWNHENTHDFDITDAAVYADAAAIEAIVKFLKTPYWP